MISLFSYIIWYCDYDNDVYDQLVMVVTVTCDITLFFLYYVLNKKQKRKEIKELSKNRKDFK